jgi:glycosyltransferase involved in cell wall biosynthesis
MLVVHPGAELYGSDRVLLESVAAFVTAGAEVVVALPQEGPLASTLAAHGARVVTCPMPVLRKAALRPGGALRLVWDVLRSLGPAIGLIRRHGRDGVYVSTITIPGWLLLARLLGRRAVVHVHEAERSAPRILRWALSLAPRTAAAVLVNSRFSLDVLTEAAPRLRDRCTVLYNGVPGPARPVPARNEVTGPVRLLFVGRLSPRKGPQVALATLVELVRRGVDARLEILGAVFDGYEWFETELRDRVAAEGLTDRVEFLGFRPDIWPVLADSDIVLIPSVVDEPFGNTAVEAVLAARPLVVSTTSGLQEAAAGYSSAQAVDPTRPDLWSDAVQRTVADWPRFRSQALQDAGQARRRHAPDAYRRAVAEIVLPDGGTTVRSSR